MPRRFRVGLTGGAGAGKSRTSDLFRQLGVDIIDADMIARALTAPGTPLLAQIRALFGEDVIDPMGALRRDTLRQRIFANPGERQRLEALLHPAIRGAMQRQAGSAGSPYCILVIPLLVETGQRILVDRVLVIDAPVERQLERLIARDQITREQARAMLAAQTTREARLAIADDVIENDGGYLLESRVAQLHERYLALARDHRS